MNTDPQHQKIVHRFFLISILVKGIDGLLETVGGVLFLLVSRTALNKLILTLTQHELMEDPDDWIATALRHGFSRLSAGEKLFGGVYLLTHGLIKLFLVIGLWRDKLWAFPLSLAFLGAFIGYQAYRLSLHFSVTLLLLSLLDLGVVLLVWREYRYVSHRT